MIKFWGILFLAINLLIRVPIRIAIRCFKIQNDKLYVADLIATLAALASFIGICICGLLSGEVESGLAIACIVLFGGLFLLISGAWLYAQIKERREKKKQWQKSNSSVLDKYSKFILIALIFLIVLVIISSIAYTVLDGTMLSARLHYESAGERGFVGCGSNSCPYCQGARMFESNYRGPDSFPYYRSISNTRMVFEAITIISTILSVLSLNLFVLSKIKKSKS